MLGAIWDGMFSVKPNISPHISIDQCPRITYSHYNMCILNLNITLGAIRGSNNHLEKVVKTNVGREKIKKSLIWDCIMLDTKCDALMASPTLGATLNTNT